MAVEKYISRRVFEGKRPVTPKMLARLRANIMKRYAKTLAYLAKH